MCLCGINHVVPEGHQGASIRYLKTLLPVAVNGNVRQRGVCQCRYEGTAEASKEEEVQAFNY